MTTPFRPRRDRRPPLSLTKPPGCMYIPKPVIRRARQRNWLQVAFGPGQQVWVPQTYLDHAAISEICSCAEQALAAGLKMPIMAMYDDGRVVIHGFRW